MSATLSDRKIAQTEEDLAEAARNKRRGRWVPWIIALFYLSFIAVLIGFVFIAYGNPPAESTPGAYEKGLAYNETLAKAGAQAELGWQSRIDYTRGRLTFILKDHAGEPLTAATVKAWFVHPGNPADDRSFDLRDEGQGTYTAEANLPSKGVWTIHVTAEKAGRQYQAVATTEIE